MTIPERPHGRRRSMFPPFAAMVPKLDWKAALFAGLGAFLVIFPLAELTRLSGSLFLIAPFGASCVLVFALPASPLAQPRNVVGGHLVSTVVGLLALTLLGPSPLAFGLGVAFATTLMIVTGTTHPPAGADPIVVILAGASWSFLVLPVLVGAVAIVVAGMAYHRWVLGKAYPSRS